MSHSWPILVLLTLFAVALVAIEMFFFDVGAGHSYSGHLSGMHSKSIDSMLNLTSIIMGWSVATIGATGLLFLREKRRSHIATIYLIMFLSALAIFFGHITFDLSSRLLAVHQLPIGDERINWSLRLQYWTAFLSLILFAWYCTSTAIAMSNEGKGA